MQEQQLKALTKEGRTSERILGKLRQLTAAAVASTVVKSGWQFNNVCESEEVSRAECVGREWELRISRLLFRPMHEFTLWCWFAGACVRIRPKPSANLFIKKDLLRLTGHPDQLCDLLFPSEWNRLPNDGRSHSAIVLLLQSETLVTRTTLSSPISIHCPHISKRLLLPSLLLLHKSSVL